MKKKHPTEALIGQGEHQQFDSRFEVSNSRKIVRTSSAFANTDDGRLLIGMKDNGAISGVRSEEEYYTIEAASKMYMYPEVPFTTKCWDVNGKAVLEVYIAPSDEKLHTVPDKDDKYKAHVRVADENILVNKVPMQAWKKQKTKEGTLLKISKPVEIPSSWLDEYPYTSIKQFCRIARINYYAARNILSDLMAMGAIGYVVTGKHTVYKRIAQTCL